MCGSGSASPKLSLYSASCLKIASEDSSDVFPVHASVAQWSAQHVFLAIFGDEGPDVLRLYVHLGLRH